MPVHLLASLQDSEALFWHPFLTGESVPPPHCGRDAHGAQPSSANDSDPLQAKTAQEG